MASASLRRSSFFWEFPCASLTLGFSKRQNTRHIDTQQSLNAVYSLVDFTAFVILHAFLGYYHHRHHGLDYESCTKAKVLATFTGKSDGISQCDAISAPRTAFFAISFIDLICRSSVIIEIIHFQKVGHSLFIGVSRYCFPFSCSKRIWIVHSDDKSVHECGCT